MAESEKNRVTVRIMGEEYALRGSASPESMQRVASYVDGLMEKLAQKNRHMSKHKIAVLAAINLADELLRYKEGFHRYAGDDHRDRGDEDELV